MGCDSFTDTARDIGRRNRWANCRGEQLRRLWSEYLYQTVVSTTVAVNWKQIVPTITYANTLETTVECLQSLYSKVVSLLCVLSLGGARYLCVVQCCGSMLGSIRPT